MTQEFSLVFPTFINRFSFVFFNSLSLLLSVTEKKNPFHPPGRGKLLVFCHRRRSINQAKCDTSPTSNSRKSEPPNIIN